MRLDPTEAWRRFASARVARMSTVDEDSRPHLVPVTFAAHEDTVVIAIDWKPKCGPRLKRLRNIEANPLVSLLVDQYTEDWSTLWWVRGDGAATVCYGAAEMAEPLDWLAAKYQQYQDKVPEGPVIRVRVRQWSGWSAS